MVIALRKRYRNELLVIAHERQIHLKATDSFLTVEHIANSLFITYTNIN